MVLKEALFAHHPAKIALHASAARLALDPAQDEGRFISKYVSSYRGVPKCSHHIDFSLHSEHFCHTDSLKAMSSPGEGTGVISSFDLGECRR